MIRKDYLERLIEQFAAAFAALLKKRREQGPEAAQQLLRDTALDLLGMEYSALTLADAASTAKLLGHPRRVICLARLVAEEGEGFQEQGDGTRAALRWGLALELFLEARELGGQLEGEDAQVFKALKARIEPSLLSERYQQALARAQDDIPADS
ncbi:hypothetical protein [Stigmatella aurantiaca]|uniref:Conserved uncharacterized protein n=1 Tax=Stigmatella aurantiaca (strain DW4/3-1) TaxID=378806 RepID=E3FKH0_STIAD|nr:hypothetical protein [Stigmatella aurantiaca]ADO67943.1 conserved uncharacterized protein [Stigmatella aurantiaca DW4/3-1]